MRLENYRLCWFDWNVLLLLSADFVLLVYFTAEMSVG